jgi:hypothetical protein
VIRDIVSTEGDDLRISASDVPRAGNILSVQVGSLEYAPSFGVDTAFFLTSEFRLQNSSFQAHLIERLLAHQVNVVSVLSVLQQFQERLIFSIEPVNAGTELIV